MSKIVFCVLFLSASCVWANGSKLQLSGRVPEKVDVISENGKLRISKNSQNIKVTVENRSPASLVRVEAP